MTNISLAQIARAVEQTPHPKFHGATGLPSNLATPFVKALGTQYPEVSLWYCVVLGFDLEALDKNGKLASQNCLDSLQTEDADCHHGSNGLRIGDEFLCEFGVVDEVQWARECKQRLVETLAKDNLKCNYIKRAELDECEPICGIGTLDATWIEQVQAAIQANIEGDMDIDDPSTQRGIYPGGQQGLKPLILTGPGSMRAR